MTRLLALLLVSLLPAAAFAQARGRLQTHLRKEEPQPDTCSADAPATESCPAPEDPAPEEDGSDGTDAAGTGDASDPGAARPESPPAAIGVSGTRHRWAEPTGGVRGSRDNPQIFTTRAGEGAPEAGGGLTGDFGEVSAPAIVAAAKDNARHLPDAGCKLEDVQAIHASMVPKDDKGSFEVTKRVAWKWRKQHAGLLIKRAGNNIVEWRGEWFSAGRICYTHNGHIWKVVAAVGTGDRTSPECLDNGYADPEKCVPAMDPSKADAPPAPSSNP